MCVCVWFVYGCCFSLRTITRAERNKDGEEEGEVVVVVVEVALVQFFLVVQPHGYVLAKCLGVHHSFRKKDTRHGLCVEPQFSLPTFH